MPTRRKRDYDLREFWPWYERSWMPWSRLQAQPPPFRLRDLHPEDHSISGPWIVRVLVRFVTILMAAAAVAMVIWRVFH